MESLFRATGHALLGSLLPVREGVVTHAWDVPAGNAGHPVEHLVSDALAHVFIHAGARSSTTACLILGEGAAQCDIEVILDDESSLTLLCIQECAGDATVRISQRSKVGAGARLTLQNVSLGGKDVEHDLVSAVAGRDATSSVDWMFYAAGTECQTLSARNVFEAANGGGEILMKGVAEDTAHAAANGLIEIGLKGGGTNTYLTQDVLMLDPTAKVDAVPGLEIKTNDVKASHSATVSRVTAEDLFYFAARGIPRREAREMYVTGFLGQITGRIPSDRWKERIAELVRSKYVRA